MNKEKQIDLIEELLIDFDEMGFVPTTLCPDPEGYAVEWKKMLTNALKGYRKAFTEEIFSEIEERLNSLDRRHMLCGNPKQAWGVRGAMTEIAELKKKHTEGEGCL